MDDNHRSLKIETKWFKASAHGVGGLIALVVIACLVLGARAFGWW